MVDNRSSNVSSWTVLTIVSIFSNVRFAKKKHTAICDKNQKPREPGMTAKNIGQSAVIHPGVVVHINGYKFCALLDSGASHLYASSTAIKLTCANLKSTGLRQIAMLTGVTTRTMQVALWSFVPCRFRPWSFHLLAVSSPSRFVPNTDVTRKLVELILAAFCIIALV